jgi:hypothetical protein
LKEEEEEEEDVENNLRRKKKEILIPTEKTRGESFVSPNKKLFNSF